MAARPREPVACRAPALFSGPQAGERSGKSRRDGWYGGARQTGSGKENGRHAGRHFRPESGCHALRAAVNSAAYISLQWCWPRPIYEGFHQASVKRIRFLKECSDSIDRTIVFGKFLGLPHMRTAQGYRRRHRRHSRTGSASYGTSFITDTALPAPAGSRPELPGSPHIRRTGHHETMLFVVRTRARCVSQAGLT